MACGGCARRRAARNADSNSKEFVMGGYKYLSDRQLRARLEVYKRNNCKDCPKRYPCDYEMFTKCEKIK